MIVVGIGETLIIINHPASRPFSKNANHPVKGSSIRVEPIRDRQAILDIKQRLQDRPRDLCLFTLGINTAYRANELLSLTVGQVLPVKVGSRLTLKQSKTKEYRTAYLNSVCVESIRNWLMHHPAPHLSNPLFPSRKRHRQTGHYQALQVSTLSGMVKGWCHHTSLTGNYGSHSLRKTWGYHQRIHNEASVALLMRAYGHSSESQTLDYLGIEDVEVRELYKMEL